LSSGSARSDIAAAAPAGALPSPDGLWRGTYNCSAAVGSFGSETFAFTFALNLQLMNGSGSWKGNPEPSNGMTIGVQVSAKSSRVTVTRSFASPSAIANNQATLIGTYDGSRVQAVGREQSRDCTLVLTR
jgi:hypothetical protein